MAQKNILDSLSLGKIVQIREQLLSAQSRGRKVFRLESGDPNFSLAPHVLSALQTAAAEGKTHYVPNAGIPELRSALAKKVAAKNGLETVFAENIFVTNGAMHALFAIFQCMLNEGDEVIVPDPMWTEVVENIKLARGIPVPVTLKSANQYCYLPADIRAKVTPRTKAIFLNTPHNPTGAVLSKEILLEIGKIAKDNNLYIVSDEAYEDVIFAPNVHVSIGSLFPEYSEKIVSIFSFSKSYAMSGLRIGYLATRDAMIMERLQKVLRCSINGVNSVSQWTALAAVSGDQAQLKQMRDEYLVRRDMLLQKLSGIEGLKPFTPQGSFFVWAEIAPSLFSRLGVSDGDSLSALLAENGVGSAPGEAFGLSCGNAIRFAFSCATQMVEEGAAELCRILK